jgi:enoyl-CoA hydratase/carnithine racemase
MVTSNEFFTAESYGPLGVLMIKPYRGVALSEISYSHAVLDAIEAFEKESKSVLLVCVPAGNFSPERMDTFWQSAEKSGERETSAQFCRSTSVPLAVHRFETGVVQVLQLLQRVSLFKIIAVDGDVDFDLLGLILACDARFCARSTVFENRILKRGVTPGFGLLWFLARRLGEQAAMDLILNHELLDAEEAQQLKLVTHVSESSALVADALRYAKDVASKPSAVVKSLAWATRLLSSDFGTYLEQCGGGFSQGRSR